MDGTRHTGDTMSKLKTDQDCNFWLRWPAPGGQFFREQSQCYDLDHSPAGESMRVKQRRRRRLFSRSVFSPASGDTSTSTASSRMTKSATATASTSQVGDQEEEEEEGVPGGGGVQEALSSLSQCLAPASPSTSLYLLPPGGASCY